MKAIGIKMVDLMPMSAKEAHEKGYKTNNNFEQVEGYEVTYPDGYKSWCPKEVADKAYFKLNENNDGSKIDEVDVDSFLKSHISSTLGPKTTVVLATTITGFDLVNASSCVDSKNYSQELGEQCALQTIKNNLWSYLGFVLQWAKNGLDNTKEENMNGIE